MSHFELHIQPLSSPLPLWSTEALPLPLPEHAWVRLATPVTVVIDGSSDAGAIALSLPLHGFSPPLYAEQLSGLAQMRLLQPWAERRSTVRFVLRGETLTLEADGVRPRAWAQAPAQLELVWHGGTRVLLEVAVPEVWCDFTARERALARDALFSCECAMRDAKVALAEAEQTLAEPERRIALPERSALAEAQGARAAVSASLDVRRAEVRAEMATARAAVWALAAEFPEVPPDSATAGLSRLSAPLLALANQQSYARERVEALRSKVGRLMNDHSLSEVVRAAAARDSKAQLSDKELTLAVLNAEVAEQIADIQRQAAALGLEDELLARADFLLGGYPLGGLEGSFRHLLTAHARLTSEMEQRQQTCVAHATLGLVEARQRAALCARRVAEQEQRLATLGAEHNWLEHSRVLHPVATRYRG